ncbi:MAG: patatin-like phospholipase family protein [Alphaproteobacteria bacterium]
MLHRVIATFLVLSFSPDLLASSEEEKESSMETQWKKASVTLKDQQITPKAEKEKRRVSFKPLKREISVRAQTPRSTLSEKIGKMLTPRRSRSSSAIAQSRTTVLRKNAHPRTGSPRRNVSWELVNGPHQRRTASSHSMRDIASHEKLILIRHVVSSPSRLEKGKEEDNGSEEQEYILYKEMPIKRRKKIFVLSIDGGGIRGIIPAHFLVQLEKALDLPVSHIFDVIAGTSTGGIIACGLGVPKKTGSKEPRYSAEDILNLYLQNAERIFKRTGKLTGVKYKNTTLKAVLSEYFEDTKVSEAIVPTLVPTWALDRGRPYYFLSHHPQQITKFAQDDNDFYMRDATQATGAAPTYFKPAVIEALGQDGEPNGKTFSCIDGGVFANNPALKAVIYAMALHPDCRPEDIIVVSLGTGKKNISINPDRAKNWGLLGWAKPIMPVFLNAQSQADNRDLSLLSGENLFRFQSALSKADPALDAIGRNGRNLKNLRHDAEQMMIENKSQFKRLIEIVTHEMNYRIEEASYDSSENLPEDNDNSGWCARGFLKLGSSSDMMPAVKKETHTADRFQELN